MDVIDTTFHFPASTAFIEACVQAGIPKNPDINGKDYEGVDYFQITQTPDGVRGSSAVTFLREAENRKNLTIITYAHVSKILFKDKTAYAVEYFDLKDGKALKK